jgi:hypothetical protein
MRRPTLTALGRAGVSQARIGTKKRTFRSNKETDEGKRMCPPCLNLLTKKAPYKGLGADSEEKHEPATDIDTVAVDSLKALDPNGPIREADIRLQRNICRYGGQKRPPARPSVMTGRRARSA